MFRRSASLAMPHLKSFAAIPSVSLVHEDVNGENLTVKKYGGFLVPIFHGLRRVFHGL